MNYFTDDNQKAYIDQLLEDILHKSPQESAEDKETLLRELSPISPASFYAFHQIVEHISEYTYTYEAFSTALLVLANLKPLLWSSPLMDYDEEIRIIFFRDLYRLESLLLCYFDSDDISEAEPDTRTYYGYLYTLLSNYSNDALIIHSLFPFRNPVSLPCGSVMVDPTAFSEENPSPIIPRTYDSCQDGLHPYDGIDEIYMQQCSSDSETPEGLGEKDCNEWDFFTNTMRFLDACEEIHLSGCLQYLYGKYTCPKCNETKTVMDFHKSLLSEKGNAFPSPSDELTDWLIAQAEAHSTRKAEKNYDSKYTFFLYRMVVWYEKSKQNPNWNNIWKYILEITLQTNYRTEIKIKKLQYIIRQISETDFTLTLANAYTSLAWSLSCNYKQEEKNRIDLAIKSREKAIELYHRLEMYDCDDYRNSILSYTILTAESSEGDATYAQELLLDYIQRQEAKEHPDPDNLGDAYNRLAYLNAMRIKNYHKTYLYFEKYLDFMKQIYGEDSDFIADCMETLADYHEDAKDYFGACTLREKALEINIREMGKLFLLPPIFKDIAVFTAKATGAIDPSDKFNRVMSAAESYLTLGDSYYGLGNSPKAKGCFQKSVALLEWEFKKEFKRKIPIVLMAAVHQRMGNLYYDQKDTQQAKKEYQKAMEICHTLIDLNESLYEIEECTEILNAITAKTGWE